MPTAATCALIWSSERNTYELRHQDSISSISPHSLQAEDGHQFIQLVDGSSFAFQGKHGRLTLRKESRPHGEGYWYAYRNHGRKTLKKYAGRTADLTIARLEEIAEALNASNCSSTDERSRLNEGDIPSVPSSASRQHVQSSPLLAPKLCLPRLHASLVSLVPRERLLTRLDAGLECRLTLLSAPAGFGKTTLVSQWIAHRSIHRSNQGQLPTVAWVSLDAGDNDPIRFWHYVITACQAFHADLGKSALAQLHTVQQLTFEPAPLEASLTLFFNELSQLPNKVILVLEDYHVITSPPIHETVAFLLDHLPVTLHLLLTTRVDPPLPLARLRAHNDLNELRAADLRFLQEETHTFLQQTIPFPLSPEVITHLDTHMEGWATGLRLVALALQGRMTQPEVEHFLTTFSGNHRHILEFFVTELLNAQPQPLQVFLLQTSILSRLTGSLCDAVTERNDSERLIDAVEHANLFLQPLDGSGQWYRYHTLFSEAMQHEARRRLGDDALRSCYGRASLWYEQHGMLIEAVEAALEAHEFARAADLMEQLIGPRHLHEMHELHTLRRWLEALPEAILAQHPRLCLRLALLLLSFSVSDCWIQTSLAPIERPLHMAEHFWQANGNRSGLGEVQAFRALLARMQGDLALAAPLAKQALAWLPESEQQWRGTCLGIIGADELLAGKLHAAQQTFLQTRALFEAARNNYAARFTLLLLGDVCFLQGELRQSAELYREVLTTAGEDLSDKGKALLGLAQLSYEWNALETAEQETREAFDLGTHLADEMLQVHASLVLARIQHAHGQHAQAQHLLHELLARMHPQKPPMLPLLHREILAWQARLELAAGNLAAVERWSTTRAMQHEAVPLLQQEQEDLVLARLLIAQGEKDSALRLLKRLEAGARQHGRTRSQLEILVLMALAHFSSGNLPRATQELRAPSRSVVSTPGPGSNLPQATQELRQALELAQGESYQRSFLDEGEPVLVLLRTILTEVEVREEPLHSYLRNTIHRSLTAETKSVREEPLHSYLRNLVLAFTGQQTEPGEPTYDSELLSPQEQRVLRLLAAGRSKPQIAQELIVSVNTVKTQVRSIYGKLKVTGRKEACDEARHLHLL